MANLVISRICNLHCAYCFARDYLLNQPAADPFLPLDEFERRLDFLARSGMEEVRLIGGEPTLHPRFGELLARAARRFAKVVVFSHGLIDEPALSALEALSPRALTVMINTNAAGPLGVLTDAQQAWRSAVMRRLGTRAMAGYTIAVKNFDAGFLIPLINESGCRTSLRLGLAQPALAGSNTCLPPRDYPEIGERIAEFAAQAAAAGIRVELDCGFVRCMFSQSAFDTLAQVNALVVSHCNPVLDIDVDGQTSHCFPLAGKFTTSMKENCSAQDLRQELSGAVRAYRVAGIYPECTACSFRMNQECSGGCLAQTIRRFHPADFHLRLPEVVD